MEKLIDIILTNKNDIDEEKEQLLSKHISEYITDDRLPSMPIKSLYRIFKNQSNKKENKNNPKNNTKRTKKKQNKKNPKKKQMNNTISNEEENDLYFKKVDFYI